MSPEIGSLFQKFESFLNRLQNGINKGLHCELVACKIKEVEVKREEEVETVCRNPSLGSRPRQGGCKVAGL
jgi:hypothetical protein